MDRYENYQENLKFEKKPLFLVRGNPSNLGWNFKSHVLYRRKNGSTIILIKLM